MTYAVKEIFRTLQGEGANAGKAAVFVRFAGCNLWSGEEKDRATATCRFCDTDFLGGERLTAAEIAALVEDAGAGIVVLTGGEPLLQVDGELLDALHERYVAVETNGTIEAPVGLDWVCVSPKAGTEIKQRHGDELKVVGPQEGLDLSVFDPDAFRHRFVQPMAGNPEGLAWATQWCLDNPGWRLSLQTHKMIGLR